MVVGRCAALTRFALASFVPDGPCTRVGASMIRLAVAGCLPAALWPRSIAGSGPAAPACSTRIVDHLLSNALPFRGGGDRQSHDESTGGTMTPIRNESGGRDIA